jgi:DNA-binding response OmpR family regulator
MAATILLVDDDDLLRRSLAFNLEQAGYKTQTAATAEDGLAMVAHSRPDLILLDVGLPGMDGLQALRELRREQAVPVIFITARRRELDEILGLEMGADDYITKPFDTDVLLARVKAVLRRRRTTPETTTDTAALQVGDLVIDPAAHTVMLQGRPVPLAAREFAVLQVLAREAGLVVSVSDLLARIWGAEFAGEPQVVYVHIRWLREKLEADPSRPQRIITVRGVGYKLMAVDNPPEAEPADPATQTTPNRTNE